MTDGEQLLLPPTARLPPIGRIEYSSVEELLKAIAYLSHVYNPEVRSIRYVDRRRCPLAGSSDTPDLRTSSRRKSNASITTQTNVELETIRADSFERAYAVRWLTTLVSQTGHPAEDHPDWDPVVQSAAHLLAICAGSASAGTQSRVFAFPSRPSAKITDVQVHITDLPLDNQDYSSVGAQTWGGACLLADLIVCAPRDYGLPPQSPNSAPLRVLELGAGTGLVGLAVGKLLAASAARSEVVMTDFQPDVLSNLHHNVAANFPSASSSLSASVHFLDWSTFPSTSILSHPYPFNEPFDVIYGADIIYELKHAQWIKACVEVLLRKPSPSHDSASTHRFHLVIPLRSTHVAESHSVEEVFPFAPSAHPSEEQVLAITEKEIIVCGDIWSDGSREVEYVHYSIAWI